MSFGLRTGSNMLRLPLVHVELVVVSVNLPRFSNSTCSFTLYPASPFDQLGRKDAETSTV